MTNNPRLDSASPLFDRVRDLLSRYMSRRADSECFDHDRTVERAAVGGRYATEADINRRRNTLMNYEW